MGSIPRVISNINQTLLKIIDEINGKLSFEQNLFVSQVTISNSGVADSTQTVSHSLQYVPTGFIAHLDRAGSVYAYNQTGWTVSQIQVKCSVANAKINLTIF